MTQLALPGKVNDMQAAERHRCPGPVPNPDPHRNYPVNWSHRHELVLRMHLAGKRAKKIAAALGYSPHRASTIVSSPLFQERKAALLEQLRETSLNDLLKQIQSEAIPNLKFLISIRDDPTRHVRERLRAARVISAEVDRVYPRTGRGRDAGDVPVRVFTTL